MAKYKVLKRFRNLETQEVYEEGQEVELTVKRADEAIANLKDHEGQFLERIDKKADEKDDKKQDQEEGE